MGLDMYAMVTDEQLDSEVDFKPERPSELHYWRKHPNLHGWMEQLYFDKGGSADSFNCVCVALTVADLDRLKADIIEAGLPETCGFFFGASDGTETEDDLAFVAKARDRVKKGYTVFYDSWW
ncbi:MAG: phosphoglycerate kinase [Roseovarius sp.]|nr:phosphoglycerate kinase [Roseovarius sp.]MBK45575.1 phosphoglycerate kinase [Roseovarius sp.]|tara:strand:+ start:4023 stop:4388 length:366 start_codon:yes stop_codon:yes gene_type:complete